MPKRAQRRQPYRRCKRVRRDDGSLLLLHLPEEMLRHIVGFSVPRRHEERWLWLSCMGATCTIFRSLAREFAPARFFLMNAVVPHRHDRADYPDRVPSTLEAPLLRSITDTPWKGEKLISFAYKTKSPPNDSTLSALRLLLSSPNALPNLRALSVGFKTKEAIHAMDSTMLVRLAQNLPRLVELSLNNCFPREQITPEQFGTFGKMLQSPLQVLSLARIKFLTDAHLREFLVHQGSNLKVIDLCSCYNIESSQRKTFLGDSAMREISQHCHKLAALRLFRTQITEPAMAIFLQGLKTTLLDLDVSSCPQLTPSLVPLLVEHAPSLALFGASYNAWMSDETMSRLIEGYMDVRGGTELRVVRVLQTKVTPAGLRRLLQKSRVQIIQVGRSNEQLVSPDLDVAAFPRLQGAREEWRSLTLDFPRVQFL